MRKILSLLCAVLVTTLVFGQSYGILVNGSTYFAGEPAGEYEGFNQYLAHVQLQQGDYCQLYDADNKAAWAVTLNSYSVEGFTLNNDRYEVAVDGCYDFYIKLKFQADELYIGAGSNCGEGVDISGGEEAEMTAIYNWANDAADQVGTTILGTTGVEVSTVKIHTNTDAVPAIKFGSSYVYADGKWLAIKPAEGGFLAGDVLSVAAVFNNGDDTKYAQIDLRAADGNTRIWMSDSASTINGRTQAGEPIVQTYTLEADQDSLFLGRYGNTGMFVTLLKVERAAGDTPEPPVETAKFYLTGDSALVVDAGLEANKAWAPAAIKSETDTMTLTLLAKQEYKLKITLDGDWATGKGYSSLSEKPEGVSSDNNDNIIFSLVEAGEVNVIYVATEDTTIFKVEGNFYVAPAQDPTVSVFGTMTDPAWEVEVPFVLSDDKTYATLTVENIGAGEYDFKFFINGEWRSNGYRYHRGFPGAAGITENNAENMIFAADVDGEYTFYWYFANDSAAIIYPEKEEPALTNGYYLVGSMNEWTPAAENLFEVNPENEGEYQLAINLDENDAIKVVYVENDAIVTWFPAEGDNYVVDHNHAGPTTMYFRPDYYEDWAAFGGYFYIVPTDHVAIDNIDANAPAVKILRDGQILIIKGDKTFNAQGQLVK